MQHITGENLIEILLSKSMRQCLEIKFCELPSEVLFERTEEFLKFILLTTKIQNGTLPISTEIDEIWHAFILETIEYELLSRHIGRFAHHTILSDFRESRRPDLLETDIMFVVAYIMNYGKFSSKTAECWPATSRLMNCLGFDLLNLNLFAESLSAQAGLLRVTLPAKLDF